MTDGNSTNETTGGPPKRGKRPLEQRLILVLSPIALILVIVAIFLPPVKHSGGGARREQCKNNLKYIGMALHNHHEAVGFFPPAFMADADDKPMHSWRVLLLPHFDQTPLNNKYRFDELYNRYRFDEPWDGLHNRQLGVTGLPVFTCPSDAHGDAANRNPQDTSYVAVVGDETAWPGDRPTSLRDFKDGTSNTLLVVEVTNSGIHWMEPRDLHVLQMAPKINAKSGQGISSRHVGCAYALLADGSVRMLSSSISEKVLQSLLTINGGEKIPEF